MSITKQRMNQIIKEELNRTLSQRGLNEGGPGEYYMGSDPDMRAQADFDRDENLARYDRDQALAARRSMNPHMSATKLHSPGHPMADIYDQQIADLDRLGEADADEQDDAAEMDAEMMESEAEPVDEAFGRSGRGGRYGGYYNNPLYSRVGSGRMSDAEARERGGRGYDEPYERDAPRGPRGGLVSSTVTIYTDPSGAADKFNANLGSRLDKAADVFLGMSGYDGMSGNLVVGTDPVGGYNKPGDRWVLAKAADGGYTFTVGETVGNGASPSEALRDAAEQGFQGSDVVLLALGGGGLVTMGGEGGEISESRLHKLAGILKD
jgi:hypothetical protein